MPEDGRGSGKRVYLIKKRSDNMVEYTIPYTIKCKARSREEANEIMKSCVEDFNKRLSELDDIHETKQQLDATSFTRYLMNGDKEKIQQIIKEHKDLKWTKEYRSRKAASLNCALHIYKDENTPQHGCNYILKTDWENISVHSGPM